MEPIHFRSDVSEYYPVLNLDLQTLPFPCRLNMCEYDQAISDMQRGISHVEAREYLNAYTYFCKSCHAFDKLKDPMYTKCIRYLVLCRIILNRAGDVRVVSSDQFRDLYRSDEFKAMRAVADARAQGSIKLFETALKDYKDELEKDPLVFKHLHDTAIKDKLSKLIEPYSGSVKIGRIADLIDLPADKVGRYLGEMIADEKVAGSLDQVSGCVIIDPKVDDAPSDIISQIGKIVDTLKRKYGEMGSES